MSCSSCVHRTARVSLQQYRKSIRGRLKKERNGQATTVPQVSRNWISENLREIWGNRSVALSQPTDWSTYNIWHISQGDGKEFFGHFALLLKRSWLD